MPQESNLIFEEHGHLVDDFVDPQLKNKVIVDLVNINFIGNWLQVTDQLGRQNEYILHDTTGVQHQINTNPDLAPLKSISDGSSVPALIKTKNANDREAVENSMYYANSSAKDFIEKAEMPDFRFDVEAAQRDSLDLDKNTHALMLAVFVAGRSIKNPIEIEDEPIINQNKVIDSFWDGTKVQSNTKTNGDLLEAAREFLDNSKGIINTDGSLVQVARLVNIVHFLNEAGIKESHQVYILKDIILGNPESAFDSTYYTIVPRRGLLGRRKQEYLRKKEVFDTVLNEIRGFFSIGKAAINMQSLDVISEELDAQRLSFMKDNLETLDNYDELIGEFGREEGTLLDSLRLDTARAEIAKKSLELSVGLGDYETRTKLEHYATRPAHTFILGQFQKEVQDEKNTALEGIKCAIDEEDSLFNVSSRIMREIPNGLERRRGITDELLRQGEAHIRRDDVEQLIVIADAVIENGNVKREKFDFLLDELELLRVLNIDAVRLGDESQYSNVLRSINLLEELTEVYGLDRIRQIDNDIALLAEELFIESDDTLDVEVASDIPEEVAHLPTEETIIFPPKNKEHELVQDFMEELERNRTGESYLKRIEWERIRQMISLRDELNNRNNTASELRIASSTTWSPAPFFVLETMIGDRTVAVVESALYGSASYVYHGAEWPEVVSESKSDAKDLGAVPKAHTTGHEQHRRKLLTAILTR